MGKVHYKKMTDESARHSEDESLWGSKQEHEEFVLLANSLFPSAAPTSSHPTARPTKWITITLPDAPSSPLKWKEQGKWHFFYDKANYDAAYEEIKTLFLSGHLPGVIKVVTPREKTNKGGISGIPILLYCAVQGAKETGQSIVKKIEPLRQKCDRHYAQAFHFKSNDRKIHHIVKTGQLGRTRRTKK